MSQNKPSLAPLPNRIAWFVAFWAASVVALAVVAAAIHWALAH